MCLVRGSYCNPAATPLPASIHQRQPAKQTPANIFNSSFQGRRPRRATPDIRPSSRIGLPFPAHLPGHHPPNHHFAPLHHPHYLNRAWAAPRAIRRWLWVPRPRPGLGKLPNDSAGADAQSQPEEQPAHKPYTRRGVRGQPAQQPHERDEPTERAAGESEEPEEPALATGWGATTQSE
ncbi:hypothetical protein V498_03429 [Pseudogymnoascus sp. VKM F-4517 (FW-2822)]|nr:hypothetical protein V498_03429 [Pseudogymnoascus sp. VKM F-4517 (FW-2822)]